MNYQTYRFSKKELARNLAGFLFLDAAIAFLFYRSIWAFLIGLPAVIWFLKYRKEFYKKRRQQALASQFLSGMQAVAASLVAGYSIETAFEAALYELRNMYAPDALIMREFRYIINQLHMNRSLETLLSGLVYRSGVEDIQNFADIFAAAKRTGGNLVAIIRNTIQCISQKEETRMEIQTCLAAKKLEQNIMSLVPALILAYIQLVSPGFLDGMYHNVAGIAIMSLCLALYALAWYWGRKIVSIEV